jgi:hypothetical protein
MDTKLEPLWGSLGGGALVAAVLTIVRLLVEYALRHRDRRLDQAERRGAFERDAEARLERLLQDRLSEADHRYAVLVQLHERLKDQYASLHAEHAVLVTEYRILLQQLHPDLPHQALSEPLS